METMYSGKQDFGIKRLEFEVQLPQKLAWICLSLRFGARKFVQYLLPTGLLLGSHDVLTWKYYVKCYSHILFSKKDVDIFSHNNYIYS